jgi:VIT1/CCC1 family predicted Fe2+/Mn2+ transporter
MIDDADKNHTTYINIPEAVGIFDTFESLQKAIYDLMIAGFSRYDISLLADQKVLEEKLGTSYWTAPELADNPDAPRAAFVSEEAIGELEGAIVGGLFFLGSYIAMLALLTPASTIAASIAAIAIGGSPTAVLGTLLARRVGKHHKDYYATQIQHGGILLWVRTWDKEKEELAVKILKGHSGRDVHVHDWSE